MRIGVDFDNTIVCFDTLFHRAAIEKKLIPATVGHAKNDVRDYLRKIGKESDWTALQGDVYGDLIKDAEPFPGVIEFFAYIVKQRIPIYIVSHKTKTPFIGSTHDLHAAARHWLERQGFFKKVGLPAENVFFELTKEKKMARIADLNCTHFIDDLPEFFGESAFPRKPRKLLFDPNGRFDGRDESVVPLRSWFDARALLSAESMISAYEGCLRPLKGGANNRTYKVEGKPPSVLKIYFQHENDKRDRLDSEYKFATYAIKQNAAAPRPLGRHKELNAGLYEYLGGKPITVVDAKLVKEAIEFFERINLNRDNAEAKALPQASEGCFSIQEHVDLVDGRVERLDGIQNHEAIDREARFFVQDTLVPAWAKVKKNLQGLPMERVLTPGEKCLSPSDFGFHNALIDAEGRVRFFDFEYAGWDDPAKTIVDFFCQPKVPVPMEFFELFASRISACCDKPAETLLRAKQIFPVYKVKWACIFLNEFLPVGRERRRFSQEDPDSRKRAQLEKSKEMVA